MTNAYHHSLMSKLFLVLMLFAMPAVARAQTASGRSSVSAPAPSINLKKNDEDRARGYTLLSAGRYEEAESIFSAMLAKDSADESALYGDALALFNLKRLAQAEQIIGKAIDVSAAEASRAAASEKRAANDQTANALTLLGVILAVKGDNAGSLTALKKATTLAPENFDAQVALGRAQYGAGDPVSAATSFRAAIALQPTDAKARFYLANALESMVDTEGALKAYRELIALYPDIAEGHLGLGVLLAKSNTEKLDDAIRELNRAVALDDSLYEAHVTLGRALIRAGRATDALAHLRRAASLAPNNPEPHYQLTIAYKKLGRIVEANEESLIVKKLHEARRAKSVNANMTSDNQN
jgi:Flp pilus assembly protein TadD